MKDNYRKAVDYAHSISYKYRRDCVAKVSLWTLHSECKDAYLQGSSDTLEGQWRDAEKEQPKDNHMVLVKVELDGSEFIDGGEEDVCYTTAYYENEHWQFPDDWYYDLKVLLWMPIPKPPKTQKK